MIYKKELGLKEKNRKHGLWHMSAQKWMYMCHVMASIS